MHMPHTSGTTIEPPQQPVRAMTAIVFALMMGVASFAAISWFIPQKPPTVSDPSILLLVLVGLGTLALIAFFMLPLLAVHQAKRCWANRSSDDDVARALVCILSINTIMRAAFVEGTGLFGAMIQMISGGSIALIAPITAVILLATLLPARSRFERLARLAQEP